MTLEFCHLQFLINLLVWGASQWSRVGQVFGIHYGWSVYTDLPEKKRTSKISGEGVMVVKKETFESFAIRLLVQAPVRNGKEYIVWIVPGPYFALQYINHPQDASWDRTPGDLRRVNLRLANVWFTQTVVPTDAMNLRRYEILAVKPIGIINVHGDFL